MEKNKCPICGQSKALDAGKLTTYELINVSTHIRQRARTELFNNAMFDENNPTPHFDWLKENAIISKDYKIKLR